MRYPALDIKMQSPGDALESGQQMSRCCDSIFQDSVVQDCIRIRIRVPFPMAWGVICNVYLHSCKYSMVDHYPPDVKI